jgi:hypothetical protein
VCQLKAFLRPALRTAADIERLVDHLPWGRVWELKHIVPIAELVPVAVRA